MFAPRRPPARRRHRGTERLRHRDPRGPIAPIVAWVQSRFPHAIDLARVEPWAGLRPATPGNVPLIRAQHAPRTVAQHRPRHVGMDAGLRFGSRTCGADERRRPAGGVSFPRAAEIGAACASPTVPPRSAAAERVKRPQTREPSLAAASSAASEAQPQPRHASRPRRVGAARLSRRQKPIVARWKASAASMPFTVNRPPAAPPSADGRGRVAVLSTRLRMSASSPQARGHALRDGSQESRPLPSSRSPRSKCAFACSMKASSAAGKSSGAALAAAF